jgi:cytochrome c
MNKMSTSTRARIALLAIILVGAGAIGVWVWFFDRTPEPVYAIEGGDVQRGQDLLATYACISCHTIPGVRGPEVYIGPPLTSWSNRVYIAGTVPNTPENLIQWIMDPQSIRPGSSMPSVGAPEEHARDMATYLYTID